MADLQKASSVLAHTEYVATPQQRASSILAHAEYVATPQQKASCLVVEVEYVEIDIDGSGPMMWIF